MRAWQISMTLLLGATLVACSGTPVGSGGSGGTGGGGGDPVCSGPCVVVTDCAAGSICAGGQCAKLCGDNADCAGCQATVCGGDGFCTAGNGAPVIEVVDGNDGVDPSRVADGMVITGLRLAAASWSLDDAGGNPVAIAVRSQSDTQVELVFPADVRSGDYLLVATNTAGSDQAAVTLTLPELTGDILIARINTAAVETVSASVLPVGTAATQVAAGDHTHNNTAFVLRTGDTITGDLGVDGSLAVGTAALADTKVTIESTLLQPRALAGTVNGVTGDINLVGVGTAFLSELRVGDVITVAGVGYTITDVVTDTLAAIDPAPTAGFADQPFSVDDGDFVAMRGADGSDKVRVDRWGDLKVAGKANIGRFEYGRCRLEFDYIERTGGYNPTITTGSEIVKGWDETAPGNAYWPSQRLTAEIYQWGWLCWHRAGATPERLHPFDSVGVTLGQGYTTWVTGNYKICGRVTWTTGMEASGLPAVGSTNPRILAWANGGRYYGLYAMEPAASGDLQTSNHGLWHDGTVEVSGVAGGIPDRWTVWTCR